jgi:ATP adenylyltransferase
MQHLHAPWRTEYVERPMPAGCFFCQVGEASSEDDRANLVIARTPVALVLLNRFPYNTGHLMVAPRRHLANLAELDDELLLPVMSEVRTSLQVLERTFSPEGFNVGANIGRAAGAGVPDHVHIHVVPRWNADTNFMPVLSEVKVVNQHLEQTWNRVVSAWAS